MGDAEMKGVEEKEQNVFESAEEALAGKFGYRFNEEERLVNVETGVSFFPSSSSSSSLSFSSLFSSLSSPLSLSLSEL